MKVYRDLVEDGVLVSKEIFDIAECTYTGKDMGERSITATIEFATPIDFQIGDYIKLPMQNLIRSTNGVNGSIASGSDEAEKFYIYTMPTIKKVARAMSNGKAFEHNVTFQSAQYELSCVQMRDLGNSLNADSVIYTGFDNVTFNGAAHELMERIMMVLKEAYHDSEGNPLWSYEISDTVNEDVNLALERFPISFSGNTVMDALLELNNKETINTTFFINNRKIYVGFKRPYFCRVTDGMSIDTNPSSQLFTFQYGKTSDKGVALQYGGLYEITKSVGKEVPITKLFAYGASRNLNRYYCSDRVKGGRYVNRLMLPSFDADGKTDFIVSEDALQRYGVREATKQFEEIYPSIRYATYGDIRQVKYCIKVKASGRSEDIDQSSYPIARIQCYKVVEGEITGVNKLVEAAPPDDLAIYIHAMDKTVKVVLYGGATDEEAIAKQKAHDTHVPTRVYSGAIPGSCFIVHDRGFDEAGTAYENADRSAWFTSLEDLSGFTEKQKEEIKLNQINYTDTFWLTDLYIFQDYEQTYFSRDGYSAWSWARLNNKYSSEKGHIASDSVVVNEIVHVEPITISDTNMTADGIDKRQSTFDIYLRDLGFTINEQNDFGDMVFLQNGTVKVSILDGLLAGQEFEISGSINSTSPSCICAFNDDGTRNEAFFEEPDYTTDGTNPQTPYDAFEKGAIWRIRLNRTNVDEADYANLNLAMPTKEINAKQGDHLVLLDIFMPDIYIHAAENRLLREARKYLEANDNGSISYSVNFDIVRMQQIPNYALQMREGLNLRVVDEDLNIRTENNGRYIADYRDNKVFSSTESDHNRVWLSANTPIDFTRGKYYTIEFEMYDDSSFDTSATNAFALLKTKNDATIAFNPSYSVNKAYLDNGKIAITIKFNLPDNFDDSSIYYPSLLLVSEISSNMRMYSHWLSYVFERDFDENTNILNYADFTIDSLTIKITDNSGNNEPIREITATLSEQTNATAWATLMNKVATTAKEGAQNKKALEEVVNTARRNYQALLSLKDSIFDPDGSCDQVFLQVMMQQVGADSMNYQLDNTRSGLGSDGQPTLFNCSCERDSDGYYHFKVYNDDTLRHYVYTQGSQAGNWEIPVGATGVDVQLNGTDSYFVCLKCPKNDTVGQWICSTKQYAVNDPEDDGCWFFNWAILTVDSGGVYTLTETRGNAYMYGDNLVCGKISTMAGNSYFDLTHGNFVLGDGTGPALSYINGVLTISGSKGDAEETLRQLGILQDDVENAQSTADAAAQAAEDAKKQAAEEAEQIRKDYSAAIAAEEDARTEALEAAVAEINGGIEALQKQVDGEVTSWFMEGEPTTTNKPASEWTGTDENGVAFDYRQRHEGDTYTDISEITLLTSDMWEQGGYVGNTGNPYSSDTNIRTKDFVENKGGILFVPSSYAIGIIYYDSSNNWQKVTWVDKNTQLNTIYPKFKLNFNTNPSGGVVSPSLADELKLSINPTAGQSWRWCNVDDEYGTGWHWHKIADSDAVKALQEAAKAQSTADGKSTTFVVEPTNYNIGDLWILAADRTLNGTTYKKGTILTANAESATFVASHWGEKVKYTDDTVAKQAVEAAANAKTAADNAQADATAAAQRLNDWATDGVISPVEKQGIKDEKARIDADKTQISNSCTQYGVSISSFETAYNNYANVLNSIIDATTEIVTIPSNFKTAQSEYYTQRTSVLDAISKKAQEVAEVYSQQQAQQALDGLEIGGRNLVLNSNFTLSAGANTTSKIQILQFAFDNDLQQLRGRDITLSMDVKLVNALGETSSKFKRLLFEPVIYYKDGSRTSASLSKSLSTTETTNFTGRISKSFKIEDKEIDYINQKAVYIQGVLSGEASIANPKWEYGTKATDWTPAPEDVDSKAEAIKVIAEEAKADAEESNTQLANMSNDNILTPQEKGSVADEWACIQEEYSQNSTNKTAAWGSATVAEWTTYNTAYTTLQTYVSTLALTDRTNNTTIVKTTFQANFANYYSANVAFLNALSKKVAELEVAAMEIGIRNLWAKKYMMDWNDTYAGITTKGTDEYGEYYAVNERSLYFNIGNTSSSNDILQNKVSFDSEKQYVLQVKWRNLQKTNSDGSVGNGLYLRLNYSDDTKSSWIICLPSHIAPTTLTLVSAKGKTVTGVSCIYGTVLNTRIYEIQLVQATKQPNDWLVAPEDVDAAVLEAKESAELANAQLDAIDNDNVIAISERAALETQLEQIQSEYNEITNDMNRYSIDPTNYEKAADKAIEALKYHCGKVYDGTNTAPINDDKSITIVAGTSIGYGYGNISAYYTARQTALESIAAAVKASAEQYADNAAQNAADEATGYVDIYTGGNKSHNYTQSYSADIFPLCNISSNAAYITSVKEDNGSGGSMIDPFGNSCLIAWNKNVGAPVNYYEIFDFGINNVYGVYRWGDTINCPKDAQLLVCLAQYDYISNSVKNNDMQSIEYPQNGTWTLNDIKVYTNNALIAQAAMYKAEGLDYLKTALTDGSTEIAGGLTMTNVLMLKNLAGSVTAGMSGLTKHNNKEDKVLMWGGATYEEAYAAANNDEYNTGSGTITTLIKKDGTGKIGIFKISETQAVVDVPNQGKVIIDASTTNGGIRVLNSSGRINAALLPTSISSFKPLANSSTTGSERSVYYSMSAQSVTSTSKTISLSRTGSFGTSGTTTEALEQYTKETTVTNVSTRISGDTVTLNGSVTTNGKYMFVVVTCELVYDGEVLATRNFHSELGSGESVAYFSGETLSFGNFNTTTQVSAANSLQLKVTVGQTGGDSGAAINSVSLSVSMGSIYMYYKSITEVSYSYPPQTIIGTDGLISLVSNSKYFMVDNSGSTQKIYAKGLQATKPNSTGNGELYVSNTSNEGLVKALYDGFSAISEVLENCRYEGSNAKAREEAKNACTNIRTQLAAISIIANS